MKNLIKKMFAMALVCLASVSAFAIEPVDGVYQIGSAQDFKEFADLVNADGRQHQFHAVVTSDFTVDGLTMVGAPSNAFAGSFDGQGHTITVNYTMEKSGQDGECGLFRRINGCTIKNLRVEGTIQTQGQLAGGIVSGIWQNGTVENCVSAVTITDEMGGDGTHGGIVARISDRVNITIRNCAFIGAINAPGRWGSGGILGWPDNGGSAVVIENCLMAGTLNLATGQDNDVIVRNTATVSNCYYLEQQGMNNTKDAIAATSEQASSGELCFLLNGRQSDPSNWFQKVGTDQLPLPLGTDVVYANGSLDCSGNPKDGSTVTYSNIDGSTRDEHQFVGGLCQICHELLAADGVYQLGSADALIRYAEIVNGGNGGVNGVLTTDIDMSGKSWTPIGQDGKDFKGHFDGQGYRILNLTTNADRQNQALFGQAVGGAIIENVIIDASCTIQGTAFTAGILGHVWGDGVIVRNCGNEANINGSAQNAAGIVGCSEKEVHISNCYNLGEISGSHENAGICAWMGSNNSTIKNCYSTARNINGAALWRKGEVQGENMYQIDGDQGTAFTEAQMASGELAFMLNGRQSDDVVWYQLVGTDNHPMPIAKEGAVVYANGALDCAGNAKEGGTVTYSNTEGSTRDDHQFADGFCTVCQQLDESYMAAVDGYYEIGNANQLKWFAEYVNQKDNGVNGKLTADIDFSDPAMPMIGKSDSWMYTGTFDGQGHKVTLGYNATEKNAALFRYVNNAVIRNLITDGTLSNTNSCTGGIFAGSRGATLVENCVSYVEFVRETGGDATFGGIGAYMHDNGTLRNCAFLGKISCPQANGNGGLLGYANGGNNVRMENCLVNTVEYAVSGNSMTFARNSGNIVNSYYVNKGQADTQEGTQATEEQLTSGELCFLLNGSVSGGTTWYQLLGTDPAPLPFAKEGAVVYTQGSLKCDGTPNEGVTYANIETELKKDDHQFTDGVCTVCGTADENYLTAVDGVYPLYTAKDIVWFAALVNTVNPAANAILKADVDLKDVEFKGIGTAASPYHGVFDGERHVISNMTLDTQGNNQPTGFFCEATAGAVIKNMTIDKSCYIVGDRYVAAFVGHVAGNGEITLDQLGNEADVTAWNQNAGGIVGCNTSGECHLVLNNCYNAGYITAGREAGGISGWLGNDANTTNCYNMGTVTGDGSESFARGNNIKIVNCFDPVSDWPAMPASPVEDFTNDTVFQKLAEAAPGIWFLSAETGGHPVLYDTGIVTAISNIRVPLTSGDYYDLQGRKVKSPSKGIYIRNGKKVVVK